MIALIVGGASAVSVIMAGVRLLRGPTPYDRMLGFNGAVVSVALIIAAASVAARRSEGVDVAIALLLCLAPFNLALWKALTARSFQPSLGGRGA